MVDMDDAMISNDDEYIIVMQALDTCTGVLIYNENLKSAIIRGTDRLSHIYYGIVNILMEYFKDYILFSDYYIVNLITDNDINIKNR